MKNPQCTRCRADLNIDTGRCESGFECCEHTAQPGTDYANISSFTCMICGLTVVVKYWRAKNFEKHLKCFVITK